MKASPWVVALFVLLAWLPAQSQEQYTLTNGRLWWLDALPEWADDGVAAHSDAARRYPVAFDKNAGLAKVHPFGPEYTVTHIAEMGEVYLALDTTGSGSVQVVDTANFSPLCVWTRTGSTGYYYQQWGSHRYYLLGSKGSLRVVKFSVSESMDDAAMWYDWDFGAAITTKTYRDGESSESYYWLVYDTIGTDATHGHWGMSEESYERPEDVIYNGYTGTPAVDELNKTYYCPRTVVVDGNEKIIPYGNGALYMPVTLVSHEKQVASMPAGKGLTAVNLTSSTLAYGEEITVTPVVDVDGGTLMVQVTPAYTEYAEEVYRRGINLDYTERGSADEFNRRGVPTLRMHYYYGSPLSLHSEPPSTESELLTVDTVLYSISNSSRRYLALSDEGNASAKLRCTSVPVDGVKVRLMVTVRYTNGTKDTMSVPVTMSARVERRAMPTPVNAPVIHGIVAGGGRMANVGGNTNVTIHSCDSIPAVFGGNDIAGWVSGAAGATLTIGTDQTDASHPVRIGSVYGGGNGYYLYRGIVSGVSEEDGITPVDPYVGGTKGLVRKSYWFNGEVYPFSYTPGSFGNADTTAVVWDPAQRVVDTHFDYDTTGAGGAGLVPYLRQVQLTVGVADDGGTHNDYIVIDSLFGGAKNAFVGAVASEAEAPDVCIDMRINGGTMFAVFGGNNYGGRMAKESSLQVEVAGTKLSNEKATANTYFSGFGRNFGIRYLFGGGNQVVSSYASVTITGGMTDTCVLGGNMATVLQPVGTVACYGSDYIFENDSIKVDFMSDFSSLADQTPASFHSGIGRYNVRCLFGGNNRAPMYNLSTVNLLSGGVGTCYGGGNAGDMRNSTPVDDVRYNSGDMRLVDSIDLCLDGWEYGKPSVLGSIIRSTPGSKIFVENIYGGCRMSNVKYSSALWLRGGAFGYVYGGNDVSGDVGSETGEGTWAVISENAIVLQNAYGGSNGRYHCHSPKTKRYLEGMAITDYEGNPYDTYDDYVGMLVPTQNSSNLYLKGGKVLSSAYGGGVMTDVGFKESSGNMILLRDSADVSGLVGGVSFQNGVRPLVPSTGIKKGSVHFLMDDATVGSEHHYGEGHGDGNVYGGGFLSSVYGLSYFKVKGSTVVKGSLFAGNDCMGSIESFGAYSTPTLAMADFKASDGTTALNKRDGGGTWNALYSAYVLIEGTPRITCVYGSGNGAYDYDGTRPEYSSMEPVCQAEAVDNRPFQSSTFIDIHTSGGMIDTVFGGGNGVGVRDNVQLLFNSANPGVQTVGTIFGGNNRDDMKTCVPDIILRSGMVENVFGGGNAGSMKGSADFKDICGEWVTHVSSYVKVETEDVTILNSLYGGCRQSDVKEMAYVDIRTTSASGINYVFGGNDVSGSVNGNTRVDVSGGTVHHIYGGSNGRYDYDQMGANHYKVYPLGAAHTALNLLVDSVGGVPFVDSTTVNLYGGTITSNVYGGSSMGDCRATYVDVNDRVCDPGTPLSLTINGAVYGGGEGYWEDLNQPHRGNVVGTTHNARSATHVHLRHAEMLSDAKAYGGGRGGDVENTYLKAYDTWDRPFSEIYGGCWGSDVKGTAHVEFDGSSTGDYNARNVFGGNDFTGDVYKSVVTINSGLFEYVYGAGNGYYDAATCYDTGCYSAPGKHLRAPNTEYVEVNINGDVNETQVSGNVYGGGLLGTCMPYKKDGNRDYVLVDGRKVADTARSLTTPANLPMTDAEDYTHVVVNIHGGTIGNNVYGGAAGVSGGDLLVYGLKQVNMDGGLVRESVYGGSENVSDGYKAECDSTGYSRKAASGRSAFTATTLRPSSILNLTGGTVQGNVYGGGYLGSIFGSVYINVGTEAVDECPVWAMTVNGNDSAYWNFKPGVPGGHVDALTSSNLHLQHAVYAGANWGTGGGSSDFSTPGVFGGETRIIVDGENYNTVNDPLSVRPLLTIDQSILGAGTSASGGDVYSRIDLRNYGGMNSTTCQPTRELLSIQRADAVWLNETAVRYLGSSDAVSAYLSQMYTLNRIDTLNAVGYNVIDVDATVSNVGEVNFYKHSEWPYSATVADLVTSNLAAECSGMGCDACSTPSPTICMQLANNHRKGDPEWNDGANAFTSFVVNNGINIDLMGTDNSYSPIYGYAYIIAQNGTNAVILASPKYPGHTADGVKGEYGGFWSSCTDSLKTISGWTGAQGEVPTWCELPCAEALTSVNEYPYTNYSLDYRVWTIGKGRRSRHVVVLAHSNPDTLYSVSGEDTIRLNKKFTKQYGDTLYNLAVAKAVLSLPPATPGHYYKLSSEYGIDVDDENREMTLIGMSYLPTTWDDLDNEWYVDDVTGRKRWSVGDRQEDNAHGHWDSVGTERQPMGVNYVYNNPGMVMGLVMTSGTNFTHDANGLPVRPHAITDEWQGHTTLLGEQNFGESNHFTTSEVSGIDNAVPELELYLLYSNDFNHTLLGTITFALEEYKSIPILNGSGDTIGWNEVNLNQPIEVNVKIQTILQEFKDMDYELLAMYNENTSNNFSRKVVLPATLQHRELYLQGVKWAPTDKVTGNGEWMTSTINPAPDYFYLTDDSASIVAAPEHNLFRMTIMPMDNVTNSSNSTLGWHVISLGSPVDIVSAVGKTGRQRESKGGYTADVLDTLTVRGATQYGLKIGELDGRSEAAICLSLNYDGGKVYDNIEGAGYIGKVVLQMVSYSGGDYENPNEFEVTVNVKTRAGGDTIFIASAPTLSRGGKVLNRYSGVINDDKAGKRPSKYLTSLRDAFNPLIYEEGDVIAILDTIKIGEGEQLFVKGIEYSPVPIIRYTGHHSDFPGEACVYRGPMIQVAGTGASLTARCINFYGGMMGKATPGLGDSYPASQLLYNAVKTSDVTKYADTNMVMAPIIVVKDNATVALQNQVTLEGNYNGYVGADRLSYGAINVSDGGTLTLRNNVTIKDNISAVHGSATRTHPYSGAVCVNGGQLVLKESHSSTAILLSDNYLKADGAYWRPHIENFTINGTPQDKLTRYEFDTTSAKISTYRKANVLLGREPKIAAGVDADLNDALSDMIVFSTAIPMRTRIGVSKWFPDDAESKRDTIQAVYQVEATHLSGAIHDSVFFADEDGYFMMYNYGVNNQRIYLQRCATFRFQQQGVPMPLPGGQGTLVTNDALRYLADPMTTCPTGGDTLITAVQGGFLPYTYDWTGYTSQHKRTPYTGNETNLQLAGGDTSSYRAALSDTLYTTYVGMPHSRNDDQLYYTVVVNDASGHCELKKNLAITLRKRPGAVVERVEVQNPAVMLAATSTPYDTVRLNRNYRAVKVEPRVWADREQGIILARITGPDIDSVYVIDRGDNYVVNDLYFCEGDQLNLATSPRRDDEGNPVARFLMWDFDPYGNNPATFVVPARDSVVVVAYYGPFNYWKDSVNSPAKAEAVAASDYYYTARPGDAGYVTTVNGDVHIYDERGLAWFISVVNGLNGAQTRQFYYNKVFLHKKGDGTDYDMKDLLWTPVGTLNDPFRGWFIGTSEAEADTARLTGEDYVVVKNIIVDEPGLNYAGLFGVLDTARISGVKLESAFVRGGQYVGGLAGYGKDANVFNCAVADSAEYSSAMSVLATRYASGGLFGKAEGGIVDWGDVRAKFVGSAVYSGGIVGHGTAVDIRNSMVVYGSNLRHMEGLYLGGVGGLIDGVAPEGGLFRKAKAGRLSRLRNNYVRMDAAKASQYAGGLVGYAKQAEIENNYVYGSLPAGGTGGVAAVLDGNAQADRNYFETGSASAAVSSTNGMASVGATASFRGRGNRVSLSEPVDGTSNLTLALNRWVRQQNVAGGEFRTWRSDLEGVNNGYPIYGEPDLIPVDVTLTVEGCGSAEWQGRLYGNGEVATMHIVDSVEMVDSLLTVRFVVHEAEATAFTDSVVAGQVYSGHGFELSEAETRLLAASVDSLGYGMVVLNDTLSNRYGCDSIVSLTLVVWSDGSQEPVVSDTKVLVYPNPTVDKATVVATGLSKVEVYDGEGRKLMYVDDIASDRVEVDLRNYATGVYFLRVHTPSAMLIEKVVKK